jgi:L-threonylcarbamoyladenylate synthase
MSEILPYRTSESRRLSAVVAQTVAHGGVVGLPTETYYGLGVNPFDPQAVDRLLRIKGRPDGKPILLLIGAREQLSLLTETITSVATILMDAFWPGPLTILFPARPSLPVNLTAGSGMVGIRLTSCEPLREILKQAGPLTGTSANRSGAPPVTTASAVADELGADIDLVIDAGPTPGGPPSTVIDARERVRVIREGAITRQMLQNVLETRGLSLL